MTTSCDEWVTEVSRGPGAADRTAVDAQAVLDLARDVAHGVDRPAAPLTAYLVGAGRRPRRRPRAAHAAHRVTQRWPETRLVGTVKRVPCRHHTGSRRTMICFEVGVLRALRGRVQRHQDVGLREVRGRAARRRSGRRPAGTLGARRSMPSVHSETMSTSCAVGQPQRGQVVRVARRRPAVHRGYRGSGRPGRRSWCCTGRGCVRSAAAAGPAVPRCTSRWFTVNWALPDGVWERASVARRVRQREPAGCGHPRLEVLEAGHDVGDHARGSSR